MSQPPGCGVGWYLFSMNRKIYAFAVLVVFSSCSAHRLTVSNRAAKQNNRVVKQQNSSTVAAYIPLTSVQYIRKYKGVAVREMELYGIPASITLAQGLYESGSGNGELARFANNHFGIKAGAGWAGRVYYKDDDNHNDRFRVYDNAEESFHDHSLFLKKRNYAALYSLDITDYRGWAHGLQRAGYATNPAYAATLISIIEKYRLYQYDEPQYGAENIAQRADASADSAGHTVTAFPDTAADSPDRQKFYIVMHGDTLYNISKRFGLTVDDLKIMNNLSSNVIRIGQRLIVVK